MPPATPSLLTPCSAPPIPCPRSCRPTILEEDCAVPDVRRSFSEPSVVGRRGALELTRESLEQLAGRRGFAMAGASTTFCSSAMQTPWSSGTALRSAHRQFACASCCCAGSCCCRGRRQVL